MLQAHGVGDEGFELNLASHGVFHHAGQLAAALDAAKGRTQPLAAGHQLEGAGLDLLAGTGHADDDRLAPAAVGAFQCRAHHVHIADAFKAVIHAPARHLDDHLLDGLVEVLGVHAVGGAEGPGQVELAGVGVDGDDAAGLGQLGTLDNGQADAAQAEHGHGVAFLHLGGVLDRAQTCGHAAAQQADLLGVGIGVDLGQRDGGNHGVFAEGRAAHVVIDGLAVVAEACRAIGHHALALGGAHGHAQIGLSALAEQAFAAFGGVQRNHMVAGLDAGHAFAHFHHDARAFVAQHGREDAFGVVTAQGESVGMTDAGMGDLDQHLASLGRRDVDFDDLQGFSGFEGYGGAGFHGQVFLGRLRMRWLPEAASEPGRAHRL